MRENFSKAFEGYFQWISKAGTFYDYNFQNINILTAYTQIMNYIFKYLTCIELNICQC